MRTKIILLTLISGVTALVLAQNGPSGAVPPNPGNSPGSPTVAPQNISPTQNIVKNPTNGMAGLTNLPAGTNAMQR